MFTGLIESVGTIRGVHAGGAGRRLEVEAHWPDSEPLREGDSIAVNGACLTVANLSADAFTADLSPETLHRTLLGSLRARDPVNLERALRLGDRLGGHLVQGHVDALIRVLDVRQRGAFWEIRFELPTARRGEVVEKGSVAVHGVSLTVSNLGPDWFEVAVIPVTLDATVLTSIHRGDHLHLETDILGKYVARQLSEPGPSSIEQLFGGTPVRRADPAFPDLLPVTHLLRPGYLPHDRVQLDPLRMSVVWGDAPQRTLPARNNIPRQPVRAMVFASVAARRSDTVRTLLERGSSVLVVLDQPEMDPEAIGLDPEEPSSHVTVLVPTLPPPLLEPPQPPVQWASWRWGLAVGLFPFPNGNTSLDTVITDLARAGASFAVTAPLLLTPQDRHKIIDRSDASEPELEELTDALFHADISAGLGALERRASSIVHALGLDPIVPNQCPVGTDPNSARTVALLRLWARRLDQSFAESSWGWRLRRAATALEASNRDPVQLIEEENLRVIPGFDSWVQSFTAALWHGGEPLHAAWNRWIGVRTEPRESDE